VIGGTGTVGRLLVRALADAGHEPVVIARSRGVDVITGLGLAAALQGCAATVDVSGPSRSPASKPRRFFTTATRNVTTAAQRAGVGHHVVLSIVGIDRVSLGYYRAKLAQEQAALAGPVPSTVLRATQFHEFADQLVRAGPGPVVLVPRMRCRPVAAAEVAAALVDLVERPAVGSAPELAGPQEEEMAELVRRIVQVRGPRRLVLTVPIPGAAGRALRGGALLPTGPGPRGRITFEEWLHDLADPG